jgi:hypothetical protein
MLKKRLLYILSPVILLLILSFDDPSTEKPLVEKKEIEIPFGKKSITDGPYIFYNNNAIDVKWIKNNRLVEKTVVNNNFKFVKRKFGFEFNPEWIEQSKNQDIDFKQTYTGVENLIAVSDIHGQFGVFAKLLIEHGVLNKDLDWIFGTGHLVVLGDIMDRGPKVTETLWLVYKIEQQAKLSGGMVHVMLGNHEIMVLNNDIRYINEKYQKTAQTMGTTYTQLFSDNSFLGNWLKSKPVMVKINDLLFVHAGISPEFIQNNFSISETNELFKNQLVGKDWDTIFKDSTLTFMMRSKGPVWYRGYFKTPFIEISELDNILAYFNVSRVIVGHTSFPNISSLLGGKIIGIDSSIKYGDYGEILIYRDKIFYRGTTSGNTIKL